MYEYIKQQLVDLSDEKYKEFHGGLIPGVKTEFLGVRVPILRKVAKDIMKGDWRVFLKEYEDSNIYEEVMLYGIVLSGTKCQFSEKLQFLEKYVPRIDNWAVCDIVCGNLKVVEEHQKEMYDFIQKYLNSDREYEIRFGVVILLQYYINENYIDTVLKWYKKIQHEGYYVKMAIAWGISVCFVQQKEKTLEFIINNKDMDKFTYNKAIQKIIESNRVSDEDKKMLRTHKIH